MSKVLEIIGPTAVGKSAFSLQLAAWLLKQPTLMDIKGIDLISADSRQVYQGLEIVSGVDFDQNWQQQLAFWQHQTLPIKLWGVSFLKPDQQWSVAHFQALASPIIDEAQITHRLPVIVGGTGLYVEQLTNPDPALHIPPNPELRVKAEAMSLAELQAWLKQVDTQKFAGLNDSDQANPRRLVRALEILLNNSEKLTAAPKMPAAVQTLILGLQADFEWLEIQIRNRVADRLSAGAVSEVEELLSRYEDQRLPVFSTTGVRPLLSFLTHQLTETELRELWFRQERQYAKRQLTWWKKRPKTTWFDVQTPDWQSNAQAMIESWLREV